MLTSKQTIQFLITTMVFAPDITDEETWTFIQRKINRDFPWLLTGRHHLYYSGVAQGWRGWKKKDQIASHAGFCSVRLFHFNVVLAWLTHFIDSLSLSRKKPVVVIVPTPESGFGAALAKIFFGAQLRLVTQVRGHAASKALYVRQSKWKFQVVEKIEGFVLRQSDLIVARGKFTHDLAISQGVKPQSVVILPHNVRWIDHARITGLPAQPTVLFVGRLEEEKGVHILLQAMAMVIKRVTNVHMLIAGKGSYQPFLEQIVASLGIRSQVSFLGWLEDEHLQKAYKESWLLVLPSIVEDGFPTVLSEAGLMGRPVVASNIGGIRDIIRDGENGLLVHAGDAIALADAIVKVLRDQPLAEKMGLAGYTYAKELLQGREIKVERVRQAIYGLFGDNAK
jgi:glycosyltransferase involved in cell wall biosynthesis